MRKASAIAMVALLVSGLINPSHEALARGIGGAPGAPAAANVPQPGTWNWPPYTEGGYIPQTTCGYGWMNPNRHKQGREHWVYHCR
jgi:hypothetical protein